MIRSQTAEPATPSISALYRASPRSDWQKVEIVADHAPSGRLVVREVGKFWPGVWLADRDCVRLAGPEFVPGEAA